MSNNPLRLPFMQNIFTGKQSQPAAESTRPTKKYAPQVEVKRYISLRIYTAQQTEANRYPSPVQYLEPGQHYLIVLQCSANRLDESQQEVTIDGAFHLNLHCTVKDQDICPIAIQLPEGLDFKSPFTDPVKIPFTLPLDKCPTCNVTFSITFITGNNINGPVSDSCMLRVKGNYTPEDRQWLKARYIETGVPENTIVLSAEPVDQASKLCQLAACNHYAGMFCEPLEISPAINIAKWIRDEVNPIEILRRLRSFSLSSAGNLMKWISTVKTAVEKRGNILSLVIFDTTAFELPWEMLEIDYDDYLGAVAQVARWLPLEAFGKTRPLKIAEYTSEGAVVSYLDKYLDGTIDERELLQMFEHSEIPSLEALKVRLEESLLKVGLLYIAAHGSDGTHLYTSSNAHSTGDNFHASWLLDIRSHEDPRPTLFINACESARIIYKKDVYAYNLVKNFLHPCASNYIGTLINVSTREAPVIANSILELAREKEGVQVAEILRRLRADAVTNKLALWQKIRVHKETEYREGWESTAAKMLNTFSYVYYGNPLARLRLHLALSEGEET